MGIIEEFIGRYRREYDFYDQAARLVAQHLEARLQAAGVRAIITYRAKAVGRLEPKVRDRAKRKDYATVDDIYSDIPDLAGVRVALYFPAQRAQVGLAINELFVATPPKVFPEDTAPKIFHDDTAPRYTKRFSGYFATHYRVHLRDAGLVDSQRRYAEATVEIQIASVLMHAWAEVEHDLVYKPYQGTLSEDEYAVLDELNGMVIAGEIALERLQRAGDARVAARGRAFRNHYELAAHLLSELRELADAATLQTGLGRVDWLYDLLNQLELATPEAVGRYLAGIHDGLERRPIADQIIDQVLSEKPSGYDRYEQIKAARSGETDLAGQAAEPVLAGVHEAIGEFLKAWIDLEKLIRASVLVPVSHANQVVPTYKLLGSVVGLDPHMRSLVERLRRMRNSLVHGGEIPDPADLREAARQLREIRAQLSALPQ